MKGSDKSQARTAGAFDFSKCDDRDLLYFFRKRIINADGFFGMIIARTGGVFLGKKVHARRALIELKTIGFSSNDASDQVALQQLELAHERVWAELQPQY